MSPTQVSALLVVLVLCLLFIRIQQNGESSLRVGSDAMSPTIQAGSTLVFDRLSEKDKIKRNDIVCFHPPINNKWIFCMRVIGIPGDLITIDPGKQTLIVQKGHGKEQTVIPLHSENKVVEGIIQEGFFFLAGDNLEHANDSRYFGLVTRDSIFGRVKDILSN